MHKEVFALKNKTRPRGTALSGGSWGFSLLDCLGQACKNDLERNVFRMNFVFDMLRSW